MAVITPFHTSTITAVANIAASRKSLGFGNTYYKLGPPSVAVQLFFQRIYGVTINLTDDGVESLAVLTTVNLG